MNVREYFRSLSSELQSVKDRVRYLIGSAHYPTDGEWKETVLRTVLRRHLPDNVKVGRGFVVNATTSSNQIDVLLYDSSKPILYKDGDLVIVTSDAVKGIIEVKSSIDISAFKRTIKKLAENAEFINENRGDDLTCFVGLFAYETSVERNHSLRVLQELRAVADQQQRRVINHVSLGESFFVRYWASSPDRQPNYDQWHSYWLNRSASGYFVNNVVDSVAGESVGRNERVWFPPEGKEPGKLDQIPLITT